MRGGQSKRARLARLGMVAMFALVALCSGRARGYTVEELGEATGRRKPDLRRVLRRLKSAGIVREVRQDFFCLTDNFRSEYERELRERAASPTAKSASASASATKRTASSASGSCKSAAADRLKTPSNAPTRT